MSRALTVSMLTCTVSLLASSSPAAAGDAQAERVIPLETGWRYSLESAGGEEAAAFDDSEWPSTRVPHMSHELSNESPRSAKGVWLRRRVDLPNMDRGTRVLLQVTKATSLECWFNERSVATTLAGQSTLMVDITDLVHRGENLLVLRTTLPGIQGFVKLHVLPPLHLGARRPMVDFPDWAGGPATVRIRTEVENRSASTRTVELRATLVDPWGTLLATARSQPLTLAPEESHPVTVRTSPVAEPPLWSPESPHLSRAIVELWEDEHLVDRQESTFGFRWHRFEPEGPFTVNGTAYPVRGVVYVRPPGDRFPDRQSLWEHEVGLLKGMGVNFVRVAQSIDQSFYDICDRKGLFVTAPMRFLVPNGTTEDEIALASADYDIENTIRELYNHPALVAWYTNGEGKNAPTARVLSSTAKRIRQIDSTRPVMCCELGWRSPGSVGLIDADIAGQGNYTGWYEGTLEHIGPYMDDYRALIRERYGRPLSILISNFGAAGDSELHRDAPIRNDYSHEYHTAFHQRFYDEIERRPWIAGGFIFCFRDLQTEQPIPRHTWKGMLDLQDRKKDAYYFYQSRWTTKPMVHITQKAWMSRDLWPAGETRQVELFSNCDRVELFHDGQSLGTKIEENDRLVWDVPLHEGANFLRAIAMRGATRIEDSSDFHVCFRPPAVAPRLLFPSGDRSPPQAVLAWNEVPGVDRYSVFAGTEADFDIRSGRLVATVSGHSLPLRQTAGPQFYKVVAESDAVAGLPSYAVGRQPGSLQWKFTNSGWLLSSPSIADLTGDGRMEIVIGSYNGSVYALRNDGSLLWSFNATDPVLASPAVAALAPAESPSVVVNSIKALYVLSSDGSLKWKYDGLLQFDRSVRSPSLADLDGDGEAEIIVGADTGKLMVFGADGELRWQFSTAGPGNQGLNPTTCLAIDLPDATGKALCFAADDGFLYLLDAQGELLWKRELGIGDTAVGLPPNYLTPAASPLHNPGPVTIITGGGTLKALDTAGNPLWERADRNGFPQISNLFRNGDRQVVLTERGTLHVLDHHGRDIWSLKLPHPRDYFLQPPICADLDADGEPDLVGGTRATNLVAISSRGHLMWSFKSEDEITGSPAVADINHDGVVDVVFGSRDGSLYVVSAGQAPPFAQESRTYRSDVGRTASFTPGQVSIFRPLESAAVTQQHEDVPYGSDPLQKVDVYLPQADRPTPVIIEFHGGGWRRGHKRQSSAYRGLLERALESGMAVVAANYRLTPRSIWPAQAEDAVRVVQFVRTKADQWNIDPQRIVLIGGSAGAHLALWVGLHDDFADPDSRDPLGRQSSRVCGIIDCWGPTDLAHLEWSGRAREAVPQLFGCSPDEWDSPHIRALIREASPTTYVSADDPPVLMIHSEDESTLPDDPNWTTSSAHSVRFGLWLKRNIDAVDGRAEIFTEVDGGEHPQWVNRAFEFLRQVFE